ncbi:hypothetical protein EVAR_69335_1 [Eumeta japonica]|uniref:Uncharacterized protein n=1 Tax=Eumeta variegata TaxID=151549 RepID=A0A4C1SEI5_EUMVA|nr:hypothetical protein EVAR_69335_1 [Eumeta japonica]
MIEIMVVTAADVMTAVVALTETVMAIEEVPVVAVMIFMESVKVVLKKGHVEMTVVVVAVVLAEAALVVAIILTTAVVAVTVVPRNCSFATWISPIWLLLKRTFTKNIQL